MPVDLASVMRILVLRVCVMLRGEAPSGARLWRPSTKTWWTREPGRGRVACDDSCSVWTDVAGHTSCDAGCIGWMCRLPSVMLIAPPPRSRAADRAVMRAVPGGPVPWNGAGWRGLKTAGGAVGTYATSPRADPW